MRCDLCEEEIENAPFTIVTPEYEIPNVCGECMNLFGNQEFDQLTKRIERLRGA